MTANAGVSWLERLEWDSDFFGFPVARIVARELAAEALAPRLSEAQAAGYRLLYWLAGSEEVQPDLQGSGYLLGYTDHKLTYALDLATDPPPDTIDSPAEVGIAEMPAGPAPEALLELALTAGGHSRFRRDPRIPEARFVALYHTWMSRSMNREIADTVWVASLGSAPTGVVTGSIDGDVAKIGLIAVNDAHRGKGVASRLLAAIGRWMVGQGAKISTVATQGDNWPARRCFERAGYAVQSSLHLHHLWREGDGR